MSKRWSISFAVAVGIISFGCIWRLWFPFTPTYQGKSARAWFEGYVRSPNPRPETANLNALRALGPASLTVLLKAMHARDSSLKKFEMFAWPKLPALITSRLPAPIPALQLRHRAYAVLAELDPDSDEALQALLDGLKDTSQTIRFECARGLMRIPRPSSKVDSALIAVSSDVDPFVRAQAVATLSYVASNTEARRSFAEKLPRNLPSTLTTYPFGISSSPNISSDQLTWKSVGQLARDLKRPNREYRYAATVALRERGLAAREALPDLIESLNETYFIVQMGAVKAIGQLGPDAQSAAPALTRLLEETTDEPLRSAIVLALHRVDPLNSPQRNGN